MQKLFVFLCIVFPVLAGLAMQLVQTHRARVRCVMACGVVTSLSAVLLALSGPCILSAKSLLGMNVNEVIDALDFVLLFVFLFLGWRLRNSLVALLTIVQIAAIAYLHWCLPQETDVPWEIVADSLSYLLLVIVSVVGSIICVYAVGYMREHEAHLQLAESKQPRFFGIMLAFLGLMNGLVLSNSLQWLYFFWEGTTLCSFLLIAHDGTELAVKNATRALWMNMLGGLAFAIAMVMLARMEFQLSLTSVLFPAVLGGQKQLILLPIALLCFAGFTKSAQMPFQSWLCGAMVAPTPVSALLHSSTMVKAGVYLVLRLAPAYMGTALSPCIAVFGGLTFLGAAALAMSQRDAKKILAYSTILTLGLIIACAGMATPESMAAAIILIMFHAITKGLLFLCVGAVDQRIGSRDIEDMRGLYAIMPRTTMLMALGLLGMIVPPFGVLLGKWMALEAAGGAQPMIALTVMIALGSALTVVFMGRWAGILLMDAKPGTAPAPEEQPRSIRCALRALGCAVIVLSFLSPVVYVFFASPMASEAFYVGVLSLGNSVGAFLTYPLFLILAYGAWRAWKRAERANHLDVPAGPYMSGILTSVDGKPGFIGPMLVKYPAQSANYYLQCLFGEARLVPICNTASIALLVVMSAATSNFLM